MNATQAADEVQAGFRLARLGRFAEARSHYERALQLQPGNVLAHAALYEIAQVEGDLPTALEHQRRMLERQTLFVERAPHEQRRLLVLLAPGDFQANVPIDFLLDRNTTTLVKLWILDPADVPAADIPQSDAVFTAIAQSDANLSRLQAAGTLVRALQMPAINSPEHVIGTDRVSVWQKLRNVPGVVMPQTERLTRASLEETDSDAHYPFVIRPVDSQGGAGFALLRDTAELHAYLAREDAPFYYRMPFFDYRSEDGYYRKYRITLVCGEPYPFHLAVSPHWMVHFYTSSMREHEWMREEERRFLERFETVFPPPLQRALRSAASTLALEYVSVDCTIDRTGRLVIFEADPAMIIHAMDRGGPFAYRVPYAERIFAAFERLIDGCKARDASHSLMP